MRHLLTTLACLLSLGAIAQITVSNSTLSEAGDKLVTQTALSTASIAITPGSSDAQIWNWSSEDMGPMDTVTVMDAADGAAAAEFPSADIIMEYFGGEGYLLNTGDDLVLIGIAGDFLQTGDPFIMPLQTQYVLKHTPITYPDAGTYDGFLRYTIDPSDFPQLMDLLSGLGLPFEPDSIRLGITLDREDEVDAYGTLRIHSGEHEVIRQKESTIMSTTVEILSPAPFNLWVDVSGFIPDGTPFLSGDTTIVYNYYSEDYKEPIASLTMTNDEAMIQNAVFKGGPTIFTGTDEAFVPELQDVTVFPNPANSFIQFDIPDMTEGKYRIELYSIIGKLVFSQSYTPATLRYQDINISHLKSGTYLYNIKNEKGETLYMDRLMVYKP